MLRQKATSLPPLFLVVSQTQNKQFVIQLYWQPDQQQFPSESSHLPCTPTPTCTHSLESKRPLVQVALTSKYTIMYAWSLFAVTVLAGLGWSTSEDVIESPTCRSKARSLLWIPAHSSATQVVLSLATQDYNIKCTSKFSTDTGCQCSATSIDWIYYLADQRLWGAVCVKTQLFMKTWF